MAETIVTKRCPKCKQTLPLSDFAKSKSRYDGHQGWCKECMNSQGRICNQTEQGRDYGRKYRRTKKYRDTRRKYQKTEKFKQRREEYRRSDNGAKVISDGCKRYKKNNPEKTKAQRAVNNAVRARKLSCVSTYRCRGSIDCLKKARDYHHHLGYAEEHWLDVTPLCRLCHSAVHY